MQKKIIEKETPLMRQWNEEKKIFKRFEKILDAWTKFSTQNKIDSNTSGIVMLGICGWVEEERRKLYGRDC